MRVAIVNDMTMAVEAMRRIVKQAVHFELAWVARNGKEAVEKCRQDTPDILLMDLIMPVMDGTEATRQIMRQTPCAIIVVTATVEGNAAKVFETMGAGALDAVSTPVIDEEGNLQGSQFFLKKLETVRKLIKNKHAQFSIEPHVTPPERPTDSIPSLVVVGASTGGPKAMATLLSHLDPHLEIAMVLIQHVDAQFSRGMTLWLSGLTRFKVKMAEPGETISTGRLFVTNRNEHLVIKENLTFDYTPHPKDYPHRPSVNIFFESVARHWPEPSAAILLTGMGRDGAVGMLALHNAGWYTLAQSKETCVVYGMPKAAIELNAVDWVGSPETIADQINNQFLNVKRKKVEEL